MISSSRIQGENDATFQKKNKIRPYQTFIIPKHIKSCRYFKNNSKTSIKPLVTDWVLSTRFLKVPQFNRYRSRGVLSKGAIFLAYLMIFQSESHFSPDSKYNKKSNLGYPIRHYFAQVNQPTIYRGMLNEILCTANYSKFFKNCILKVLFIFGLFQFVLVIVFQSAPYYLLTYLFIILSQKYFP